MGTVSASGGEALQDSRRRDKPGDLAALNSNRFEALKGNRKGQYSIRINEPVAHMF